MAGSAAGRSEGAPGPWADEYVAPAAPPAVHQAPPASPPPTDASQAAKVFDNYADAPAPDPRRPRPLLASDYKNIDELKKAIDIQYLKEGKERYVQLSQGKDVQNILREATFSEDEVKRAQRAHAAKNDDPAHALLARDPSQAYSIYNSREKLAGIQMLSHNQKGKGRSRSTTSPIRCCRT